jgi:hypothetical protein
LFLLRRGISRALMFSSTISNNSARCSRNPPHHSPLYFHCCLQWRSSPSLHCGSAVSVHPASVLRPPTSVV